MGFGAHPSRPGLVRRRQARGLLALGPVLGARLGAWVPDIQRMLVKAGPKRMLRENPYAEWYLNSMRIKGSPTARHHAQVYGDAYPYDNFVKTFDDATAEANLDALAFFFFFFPVARPAARYVVLTTKHHDGFAGPSAVPHPVKGEYHAACGPVGDLSTAARRMRMGLYSGGYDWPVNGRLAAGYL